MCCSEVDRCGKGPRVHYQCELAGLVERSDRLHEYEYVFVCAVPPPAGDAASVMARQRQPSQVVPVLNIQ
jgi:hypothetical protein